MVAYVSCHMRRPASERRGLQIGAAAGENA
jgi:hypothetical protein